MYQSNRVSPFNVNIISAQFQITLTLSFWLSNIVVQISLAGPADIPALARVIVECEAQDPLIRHWYGSCDPQTRTELPGVVLSSNLENSTIRMFKATLADEVVGYGSLSYSQGDIEYPISLQASSYEGMNNELYITTKNEIARHRKKLLDGKKHISK